MKVQDFDWSKEGVKAFLANPRHQVLGKKKRAVNGQGSFPCTTRNKKFTSSGNLERHQAQHNRQLIQCSKQGCNFVHYKQIVIQKNYSTHKLVCDQCSAIFKILPK